MDAAAQRRHREAANGFHADERVVLRARVLPWRGDAAAALSEQGRPATARTPTLVVHVPARGCPVDGSHAGIAPLRNVDRVLVTAPRRVRFNDVGVLDVLEFESKKSAADLQREDLVALGRLLLSLACRAEVGP